MRINRLRRARTSGNLTDAQRSLLLFDHDFCGSGPGFENEAAERAAWKQNRAELMAEGAGPGRRAFGYFKHELGEEPQHWYEQVAALLKHDLIDKAEAVAIENENLILSRDQGPLFSGFENRESVRLQQLSSYVLQGTIREFEVAAQWHRWRGRPELEAKYLRCVEAVRAELQAGGQR